jgi:hypothetical protein
LRPADPDVTGPHRFFYPELTEAEPLRQEIFALGYHLHWSWSEAMDLEIDERQAYVRLLADVLAEQKAEMDRARAQSRR